MTISFGLTPPMSVLEPSFLRTAGETFYFVLHGVEAETADAVGLDTEGAVEVDEFYDMIDTLVAAWNEGQADAGDLASSFLQAVGIEWV